MLHLFITLYTRLRVLWLIKYIFRATELNQKKFKQEEQLIMKLAKSSTIAKEKNNK